MPPKNETQFIRACSMGRPDVLRQLLREGMSPDTRDNYGLTGLIWAARKGHINIAEILLSAGADVEGTDRTGRTAVHHAVAFKRHALVAFLISHPVNLNSRDMHGCTPLDLASMPLDEKMVRLLKAAGAGRNLSREPVAREKGNSFYFGAGVGGPDLPIEVERIHIQFATMMRNWSGKYTEAIRMFAFVMYVDASLVRYTETMNILGPQKAKRKRDWVEVRIGVPETWWREDENHYKTRIVAAVDEGFSSMTSLLTRNKHEVDESQLRRDWQTLKNQFLDTPAPRFAAEGQRGRIIALANEASSAITLKKNKHPAVRS